MLEKAEYRATEEGRLALEWAMSCLGENRGEHFGNARLVRNLFEHVQQEHANRLSSVLEPSRDQLLTIEPSDLEGALAAILPAASAEEITRVKDGS